MIRDAQGNAASGATPEAMVDYDAAVAAFSLYRGDPIGAAKRAVAHAPDFAMARLLMGWLFALATEPGLTAHARTIAGDARDLPMDDRARAHLAALDLLLAGEWTAAARAMERLSMTWPRDLVALQAGHLMDFFRADAVTLRDRIARALPLWPEDLPGRSCVLGMHAFGLEETADYARAEAAGREAIAAEPRDAWAHHAVAHVMEMEGRAEDGLGWMIAREPHWSGDDSFFQVHNWWHRGLCHLELDQPEAALALYDGPILGAAGGAAVNLVDASSLLWRIAAEGHDPGDRWAPLALAWDAHADGRLFPFNDFHAAMAWLGAGRTADVERLIATYRAAGDTSEVGRWAAETALPLIEGFAAFHRGAHAEAVDLLLRARRIVGRFGGSHAQRDVIDWTLTEAALRGGLRDVGEALSRERLALRPHSPVNRRFLSRARTIAA